MAGVPRDGYLAWKLGAKIPENPFKRGTKEYRKWVAEWQRGYGESQDA